MRECEREHSVGRKEESDGIEFGNKRVREMARENCSRGGVAGRRKKLTAASTHVCACGCACGCACVRWPG